MAARVQAAGDTFVRLPTDFPLGDAAFHRDGADLVVSAPGRAPVLVRDFFEGDTRPALVAADGSPLPNPLAAKLAAAGTSPGIEAIGRVETLSGHVFVVRADGTRVELALGSRLHDGDILETGADGAVGIVLADETSLAMGADGRMVLDEMIYDPDTQSGSMSISVVKGLYTIVSGLVSKTDPNAMVVETPVGTVGIRGTQIGLDLADGRTLNVVMMREGDGYVGEAFVRNAEGLLVMNRAHQVVFVGAGDGQPTFLAPMDDAGVVSMFEPTLAYLPRFSGRENDYGALGTFDTEAGRNGEQGAGTVDETIRVVAGDYTKPRTAETQAVAVPETPAPQSPTPVPPADHDEAAEAAAAAADASKINEGPLAFDESLATPEDQAITGQLTAFDPDNDVLTYTLTETGAPQHGTVALNPDGTFTYTPDADYSGTDSFSYLVSDGRGGTTVATATVTVAPVAEQPTLQVSDAAVDTGGLPTDDRLTGTGQADTLVGGGGSDTLIGRAGDDVLYGDSNLIGAVTVPVDIQAALGGDADGSESLAVNVTGVPEGAALSAGSDLGGGAWSLTPDELPGLTITLPDGYRDDFQLDVTANAVDVDPDSGATDTATAAAPLTFTFAGGEPGDDVLSGGGGDDVLYGGAGDDDLSGNAGADVLHGEAGDDVLSGGGGTDVLYGGAGNDVLEGDQGDDVLSGGAGDDRLEGGGGDDVLAGGAGDDVLVGGGGRDDSFVFQPGGGHDIVDDYRRGETLRFEGPEFSPDNVSVVQSGDHAQITFGDHPDMSVTVNDVDVGRGYQVAYEPDADTVVVTFDDSS